MDMRKPQEDSEIMRKLLQEVNMLKAKLREVENERRYVDTGASTWTTYEDQDSFDSNSVSLSHGLIFYGDGNWGYDSANDQKRLDKLKKQRCSLKRLLKKQTCQYQKNIY